ncbi:hypothetical protein DFJ73DRAFT_646400 [Zopfochytrium polystomum]|nr:hypothetical protein DFJ73DRAFT_646400 [Zopfochytrium polystomum]
MHQRHHNGGWLLSRRSSRSSGSHRQSRNIVDILPPDRRHRRDRRDSAPTTSTDSTDPSTSSSSGPTTSSTILPSSYTDDGSCGDGNGLSCYPGFCCSEYGFCGQTDDFCGAGCQSNFGRCGNGTTSDGGTTTTPPPSPSTDSQPSPTSTSSSSASSSSTSSRDATIYSDDGSCGGSNNWSCYPGFCCSAYGYCGQTEDFCGVGCQSGFGQCGNATSTTAGSASNSGGAGLETGPSKTVTESSEPPVSSATLTESSEPAVSSSTLTESSEAATTLTSSTSSTAADPLPTFVSTTGECGQAFGLCPLGLCCSQYGYCGSSAFNCDLSSGCNPQYGDCTGLPQDSNIAVVYSCTVPGTVAITFDDGPYTTMSTIADAFTAAGGRTTFFLNGQNRGCIYDHAADVLAAYAAGHQIAAHTWSHPNITTLTEAALRSEMSRLDDAIKNITGARPLFFRPPLGAYNRTSADIVGAAGYTHFVLWDETPQETSGGAAVSTAADVANEKATYEAADPATPHIFLQHGTQALTVSDMVPFIIDWAIGRNLSMVTVAECLGGVPMYRDVEPPGAPDGSWTCS